jgi:uncharacterized membrane protein YcaP (DUF421 family)
MQRLWDEIQTLVGLGTDAAELSAAQMAIRAVIVYLIALALVRLGSRRLLSKASAFDFIVAIMLGSVMSRAITRPGPFFPTLLAAAALLAIHWLFAFLAYHTSWFGSIVKGDRVLLIKDGQVQRDGMRRAFITESDLAQALRLQTKKADLAKVERAYLERDGQVSFMPYPPEPQTVTVSVEDGVKTVRVELQ